MKSAIAFIKFILFMLFVAWLASCTNTRKAKIAEQQKIIKFDLDLLAGQLATIGNRLNDVQFQKTIFYPAASLSEEEKKIKLNKAKESEGEYEFLVRQRIALNVKMILLKLKYDSLNVEYLKY